MIKFYIPILLSVTIVIAGVFALMPVYEASTVHTTLQETSTNFVTVTATATTEDDDFIITCGAGIDACRILEVYLNENSAGTLDPGAATVDLDGRNTGVAAFQTAADTGVAGQNGVTVALTGVANTALPPLGVLRIEMEDSDGTSSYILTVIAETEANTTITVDRIGDAVT